MTYAPKCEMAWREMVAGADDQCRTVEQVMAELNNSLAVLTEIEQLPQPHNDLTQYRRLCAEWIAHRAIVEAQAMKDMQAALRKAILQ